MNAILKCLAAICLVALARPLYAQSAELTPEQREHQEAMGSEEGPGQAVGILHGNWVLRGQIGVNDLLKVQILHGDGDATADGYAELLELVDESERSQNTQVALEMFGPNLFVTITYGDRTLSGTMMPIAGKTGWQGAMSDNNGRPMMASFVPDIPPVREITVSLSPDIEGDAEFSAVPIGEGMMLDAWAPMGAHRSISAELEIGKWRFSAIATDGQEYEQDFFVTAHGNPNFVIATIKAAQPDYATPCNDTFCYYTEPESGVTFARPRGWTLREPYFYTTAGGVRADTPTIILVSPDGQDAIDLNLRQRTRMHSTCYDMPMGMLCAFNDSPDSWLSALELMRDTLSVEGQ